MTKFLSNVLAICNARTEAVNIVPVTINKATYFFLNRIILLDPLGQKVQECDATAVA